MKTYLILLILILSTVSGYGKGTFRVNSKFFETLCIEVNRKAYEIDGAFIKIETNYPSFDTMVIWRGYKIICNFKPDSSYTFIVACCGEPDIVPTWKAYYHLHDFLQDSTFTQYRAFMLDSPFISLKIINGSVADSIYGLYETASAPPSIKLLNELEWEYGVPEKGFYWSNFSSFSFFKTSQNLKEDENYMEDANQVIRGVFPESPQVVGQLTFRLFDNNRYVISYDVATKKVLLKPDR